MAHSPRDEGGVAPQATNMDRRVHQRRAITPRLYVVLHGSDSDGILNDLSEGGAALEIVGPKPQGETLLVEFEMSETGQRFEAPARITWRDESAKKIGVQFIDLPDVSRSNIREWLATKSASTRPVLSATLQDSDREAAATLQPTQQNVAAREDVVGADASHLDFPQINIPDVDAPQDLQTSPALQPDLEKEQLVPHVDAPADLETLSAFQPEPDNEQSPPPPNDRLVQSLLDSFNHPGKKHQAGNPRSLGHRFFSGWTLRRWIFLGVAIAVAILLALGVAARRSPDRNAKSFSISKVGQSPVEAAGPSDGGGNRNSSTGSGSDDRGGPNGTNPPDNSQFPPSALLSSLAASLPAGARTPCVNLAPPADKIRIYLWAEKDTPDVIVSTYRKNLNAVLDVRVVNAAPYDLVLYVNGASVRAKTPPAGFVWSSRVFRPWYCGQSLGLLEQTKVSESLHYVQSPDMDQSIRAEVAYLILRALEDLRKEHTR